MSGPVQEAIHLIHSGKYRILSLDIFDTTVWRAFPTPADLFYGLGDLLKKAGVLYPSASGTSFAAERVEAEHCARRASPSGAEVTIEEIYRSFPAGYLKQGSVMDVMDAELTLERHSTYPDAEILDLIRLAEAQGLQIAFVSDTYFQSDHLRRILPVSGHYLMASCELRRSKGQGLHQELIRQSRVNGERILHMGDNREADVVAPARLGLRTIWRPHTLPLWSAAIERELPATRSERGPILSDPAGDTGLNAARVWAARLSGGSNDIFCSWGASFLGPLMAGFGQWVRESCWRENIGVALCLMREGRIIKQVLDGLATGAGEDAAAALDAREFFISRYAMARASIFHGTIEELTRFIARPTPARCDTLLEALGLLPESVGRQPTDMIAAQMAYELAEQIATEPVLRAAAVEASAQARLGFLAYLRKALPAIPDRVAVVDLGYSGTIQGYLQAIFDHEGIPCRTHGLYFVTGSGIRRLQRNATPAEGFLAENGQPLSIAHSFMRSPELVEQCLMCDTATTVGYTKEGSPRFGDQQLPAAQLKQIGRVQEGLMIFVQQFAALRRAVPASSHLLRPFLEAILVRALTTPTPEELSAFGSWLHDENLGSTRTRSLISGDLDEECIRYASAHQLASLQSADAYWIFGLAHRTSPVMGEAVKSIFLRKAHPEAFNCPDGPQQMHIFWNDGAAHRIDKFYTLSSRRTAWTRIVLDFSNADLLEVGFSLGKPGDVVQVGAILLRLLRPGREEEVIRQDLSEVETFGMEQMSGSAGTYLVTEVAGIVSSVRDVRGFTGVVQIDLLFSHLESLAPQLVEVPCLC